jgi:protein-S-isoprenylcysteine O-methyltransferase Ste14
MKAAQFEFRFRIIIILLLYTVGFWAPWTWTAGHYRPPASTAWLAVPTLLNRWGWMRLDEASLLVTSLAVAFGLGGASLRLWGTAYLSASVVHSSAMHGDQVMASGPYRYLRNPLYLGSWLLGLSIAILMPPSGAAVFAVLLAVFYFRLILGEEAFLEGQSGEGYLRYKNHVPRLLPRLRARIPASGGHPQWGTSLVAEIFPVGFSICLAALAWRYQPFLLVQCLLVSFGLSLVTRAFLPKKPMASA